MDTSRVQWIGDFCGYRMEVFAGVSYQCPGLRLYGYETERKLRNAIVRKAKRTATFKGE